MQDALTLTSPAESREARRAACEARDWIRRGHIPGSAALASTLRLVAQKRGDAAAMKLRADIDAWYPTRAEWLPALLKRHAEAIGEPLETLSTPNPSPSTGPRPSLASRLASAMGA